MNVLRCVSANKSEDRRLIMEALIAFGNKYEPWRFEHPSDNISSLTGPPYSAEEWMILDGYEE